MGRLPLAALGGAVAGVLLLAACQSAASRTEAAPTERPDTTRTRFDEAMAFARAEALHERPIGAIMTALGERFLGAPYLAGTLDEPDEERLVVRFDGFDCVTFVETMLALARGVARQDYRYATFAAHLEEQRYRDGRMNGYCSRLHYFSEWIANNHARGVVRDVTAELGGVPLVDTLDFMSAHRDAYPRFATNDSLWACVRDMEVRLRGAPIYYVPQDRIRAVYDRLQTGDIVGLATRIDGLDIAHTGLVYKQGDRVGLLHASLSGTVKVSPDLQRYVQNIDHQIGIVVARPRAPGAAASLQPRTPTQ
mgnify:CR=1 FL=1